MGIIIISILHLIPFNHTGRASISISQMNRIRLNPGGQYLRPEDLHLSTPPNASEATAESLPASPQLAHAVAPSGF